MRDEAVACPLTVTVGRVQCLYVGVAGQPVLKRGKGPLPAFPAGFAWGVATSSYQIEGAWAEDGKGPSVWDTYAHTPGTIRDGATGDVACDHYHRWEADLGLMSSLGVNAYRFSVSWPRIVPTGAGAVEPRGLDFYDRLVDGLVKRGIAPYVTLFHWDLPQGLEDRGGWTARDTAERFAEYAGILGRRLGDRVAAWITLNEPTVQCFYGYALGSSAPGRSMALAVYPVVHHLLLGHGLAVQALRAAGVTGRLGITDNLAPVWPQDPASAGDRAAVERYGGIRNWQFLDPIVLGRHPFDVEQVYLGSDFSVVREGDARAIAEPIDFLGVNYYAPELVRAPDEGNPLGFEQVPITGVPRTGFDWPVVPEALTELLGSLRVRYAAALPPIYITENGTSIEDVVEDGHVHDEFRIAYVDRHLRALGDAMAAGADVRGYFYWTLMDNFEWEEGFGQRFGLVYTDFATQARIPKDSFDFYRSVVSRTAAPAP